MKREKKLIDLIDISPIVDWRIYIRETFIETICAKTNKPYKIEGHILHLGHASKDYLLTSSDFLSLQVYLNRHTEVKKIIIDIKGVSHNVIVLLSAMIANNTTLIDLDLSYNDIDAESMKHLAVALAKNTVLTSINLNGNKLGAEGAEHLAGTLAKNTTLTSIDLRYNELGTAGAQHLLEAILKNPFCTTIELDCNDINKKLLSKINQQLNINKQRKAALPTLPTTTKTLCLALQHGSLFAKKTVVISKGFRKHLIKKIVGHAYELTPNQVDQLLLRPK